MRIPLILTILVAIGCGGGNGYVLTRDGRMVTETPAVASEELTHRLAARAADAAGPDWQATASIRETPVLHQVRADEYGWSAMTVDVTLVPPVLSVQVSADILERVEVAVREAALWRVAKAKDVQVVTAQKAATAPLPGSQHYTSVAGDTWAGISTAFYGTTQHWRLIADANPGVDAAPLPAGTVLVIPPKP